MESNDVELDDELNMATVDDRSNYDGLNDFDRESWSVDNPGTRIFTLRPEGISNIEIEIRYTLNEYWGDGSDYHKAWDAYHIATLPRALSDALFGFVIEAGTATNRAFGHLGEPNSPTKRDVTWLNEFQRDCLEKRLGIRKKRRGGQRRLDWPNERKIAFLEMYETMKSRVKDAANLNLPQRQSTLINVRKNRRAPRSSHATFKSRINECPVKAGRSRTVKTERVDCLVFGAERSLNAFGASSFRWVVPDLGSAGLTERWPSSGYAIATR